MGHPPGANRLGHYRIHPSDDAVRDARRVLTALEEAETLGSGAAQLDGQMLDEAVAVAARRTLARAEGVTV
ncbi:hypothetical protein GCM10020255_109700 [Rhodococcus baikonurensis]